MTNTNDARIILLNEYITKQRSFAINGLTIVIAFFANLQIIALSYKEKIISISIYFFVPLLSSLIILCFFRYQFYENMISYVKGQGRTNNLQKLENEIKKKVIKKKRFIYSFGEIKVWISWILLFSLFFNSIILFLKNCSCALFVLSVSMAGALFFFIYIFEHDWCADLKRN